MLGNRVVRGRPTLHGVADDPITCVSRHQAPVGQSFSGYNRLMELTADDLWPLVSKLSPEERIRLVRLAASHSRFSATDAPLYRQVPIGDEEFREDGGDPLAWDADGWDDLP